MNSVTSTTTIQTITNITMVPDDDDDPKDWLDIVLPALGIAFLFLVGLVCFNFLLKFFKSVKSCCCCKRDLEAQTRTSVEGHANPENVGDDLPPSYSVAGLGRSSVEVFRVVADDVSDVTYWHAADSDISEKLPTYLEIMEEKQLKAGNSATGTQEQRELDSETVVETSLTTDNPEILDANPIRLPHATIANDQANGAPEDETEPPPYETVSS